MGCLLAKDIETHRKTKERKSKNVCLEVERRGSMLTKDVLHEAKQARNLATVIFGGAEEGKASSSPAVKKSKQLLRTTSVEDYVHRLIEEKEPFASAGSETEDERKTEDPAGLGAAASTTDSPYNDLSKHPIFRRNEPLFFSILAWNAYHDPNNACLLYERMGFPNQRFISVDGSVCYVLWGDGRSDESNHTVVVFRGTQTASHVISDLQYKKREDVHGGFLLESDKTFPDLHKLLAVLLEDGKSFYLCGHSLGGAMALVAACRLNSRLLLAPIARDPAHPEKAVPNPNLKGLYTFGSPLVGDQKYVDGIPIKHYRFRNNLDVIPTMPPPRWGFRHHGMLIRLHADGMICDQNLLGEICTCPVCARRHKVSYIQAKVASKLTCECKVYQGVKDHSMGRYVTKLARNDFSQFKNLRFHDEAADALLRNESISV